MQEGIHPKYVACTVTCGCGHSFETRSLKPTLNVEICSVCHPFYTGKQRYVDTEGRVEKFKQRFQWTADQAGSETKEKPGKKNFEVQFKTVNKIPAKKKAGAINADERFDMSGSGRRGGGGGGRRGGGGGAGGGRGRGQSTGPAGGGAPKTQSDAPSAEKKAAPAKPVAPQKPAEGGA